jgi:hypothetical protein
MLMSTRHDRLARVLLLGVCGLAGALASGCKEEFSDEKFGVLDLASFYDGGTRNDPAAGVPKDIKVEGGYIEGQVAEFYDFGAVPPIRDSRGVPVAVRVQPMYFFFDSANVPLFSRPKSELKNGIDWMKGGKGVLDPNPKDFCANGADPMECAKSNEGERSKSYPLRRRDLLIDPSRGVADYQRPLVDVVPGDDDPPNQQYTGLWEMIEVTVPDDYEPDAIKQVATLRKALDSGKFKARSNNRVINCPIVDERTNVQQGITARGIYHPRIELWYRRQLAFCYLANGWETLGNAVGELYFAHQDAPRFDTMDVARIQVGSTQVLAASVGRIYVPYRFAVDPETEENTPRVKIIDNLLVAESPKRNRTDPAGYTPMRWVFKLPVAENFVDGSLKAVSSLPTERALGTDTRAGQAHVRNISVRGVAVPCSYAPIRAADNRCGKDISMGSGVVNIDPSGDPACNAETRPGARPLECNPDTCFCDAPFVGYGEACGPGVAQCQPKNPKKPVDGFFSEGLRCWPPWGGFCQRGCDPGKTNTLSDQNEDKMEGYQLVDSRCGGLPGLVCYGGQFRTCLKFCDQNVTDPKQCSAVVRVGNDDIETQEGQTCQDFGVGVCAWPDSHTPGPFPSPPQ